MKPSADRDLGRALEGLQIDVSDPSIRLDMTGPAAYKITPPFAAAVLCLGCGYVGIRPSLPIKPALTWTCAGCGRLALLNPPLDVLAAALDTGLVAAPRTPPPA